MIRELIALGTCIALLGACSSFPKAPAYPKDDPAFAKAVKRHVAGLPNDRPVRLVLHPGDIVRIETVSTVTEVREGIVVDGTGRVHVALAGDIEVAGLGLSEAEAKVQKALRPFDTAVHVNLQLTNPAGQRVTVIGAVPTPGRVQLAPGTRVADVIASVGGPLTAEVGGQPTVVADLDAAVLTRNGKPVPISIAEALKGDTLHNVYLRPGDHIHIPALRGGTVSVLGQVGAGGTVFPYRTGIRLTEVLAMAGGVTTGADKTDIRVIRGPLTEPLVYEASLRDIVDGESHDVSLHPGDVVFVTDHAIEDFSEVTAALAPIVSLTLAAATFALAVHAANTAR